MNFLLILLIMCMGSSAAGSIYEMDLLESGDALVTRDTEQDLDWLDVTLTTGLGGVPGVLAGAGGWLDDGWRLATTVELCSFLGRASGHSLTCPGQTYESGNFGQPVLDLLGMTDAYDSDRWDGVLHLDQIWASLDDGDLSDGPGGIELSVDTHTNGQVQTFIEVRDNRWNSNVLLVRSIPEPSTGSILGIGLVALTLFRRLAFRAS